MIGLVAVVVVVGTGPLPYQPKSGSVFVVAVVVVGIVCIPLIVLRWAVLITIALPSVVSFIRAIAPIVVVFDSVHTRPRFRIPSLHQLEQHAHLLRETFDRLLLFSSPGT